VYPPFRRWRLQGVWQRVHEALRRAVRRWAGRDPEPSAAIMDRQSVKTTEESGRIKGYDGGKQVRSIYRCLSEVETVKAQNKLPPPGSPRKGWI
jgi:transposase